MVLILLAEQEEDASWALISRDYPFNPFKFFFMVLILLTEQEEDVGRVPLQDVRLLHGNKHSFRVNNLSCIIKKIDF